MSNLFGGYYVKPTGAAVSRAIKLCNSDTREFYKLRAHALKLAYWPDEADLDWDWIRSLEKDRIGELRIDERIAGHDNIRIIFFKANKPLADDPFVANSVEQRMPRIWILTVFQKKRNDFTKGQIAAFRAQRAIIVERNYKSIFGA